MLKVPGRGTVGVQVYAPKIPKPEEIAILRPELLTCSMMVGESLRGMNDLWAIGGDTGLVLHGVPVEPDRIEVITTAKGVDDALSALRLPVTEALERGERAGYPGTRSSTG